MLKFIPINQCMKLFSRKKQKDGDSFKEKNGFSNIFFSGIVIILIILSGILATTWFLYTNIYQTLDKVESISALQSNPNFEPIDFRLYNETQKAWEEKQTTAPLENLRDPFNLIIIEESNEENSEEET